MLFAKPRADHTFNACQISTASAPDSIHAPPPPQTHEGQQPTHTNFHYQHYHQAHFGHCLISSCDSIKLAYYTTHHRQRSASRALQSRLESTTFNAVHPTPSPSYTYIESFKLSRAAREQLPFLVARLQFLWRTATCVCTTPFIRLGLH